MGKLDHPWFEQWWILWLRIGTAYILSSFSFITTQRTTHESNSN